jgi:2,4-dienoyl-CoA reductase-like NADH-dependent reductase (Old Yellow Enzyme family)
MSTAHEPGYAEEGMPKERYRLYHAEKAKGGIALTMTAGSAVVSRDSPAIFNNLHAYDDGIVPWLHDLADACHEHDCKVMIQITHLGRRTAWNRADWLPILAASPVREPAHRGFPKAAEDWDLDRIVSDYATAAQRCQAAGLDGIEIEAHGHLMDNFWSLATNHRVDEYGGSLENRMRFSRRVIDAVRAAVGPDFVVGVRMVADEEMEKGLSKEEGIEIARLLSASGKINFLNIVRGNIESDPAISRMTPPGGTPVAPHLDFAGEVRTATNFPVFHAGRIADTATARYAIASGKLDMVGMTRAHMADPYIVAKIMAGEEDRIRPCVGATYCVDSTGESGHSLCIHNAATGREATVPHIIAPSKDPLKRVVVAGAGPAGLEIARVAAQRGHSVTVLEAANQPGGQIRLAALHPMRKELMGIVDWRLAELERLGVEIVCNRWAEKDDILHLGPDVAVIATGGLPQNPQLDAGDDLVVSSWDILSGTVAPAQRVLVYDENGAHPGLAAADIAARSGAQVELVLRDRKFAPDLGEISHVPYLSSLQERGGRITIATRLTAVSRDGNALIATLGSDYVKGWRDQRCIDQVVVEHGTAPLDDLYLVLRPLSSNLGVVDYTALIAGGSLFPERNPSSSMVLFRIGDAVASRNIHAAIYDGLRFALRI